MMNEREMMKKHMEMHEKMNPGKMKKAGKVMPKDQKVAMSKAGMSKKHG